MSNQTVPHSPISRSARSILTLALAALLAASPAGAEELLGELGSSGGSSASSEIGTPVDTDDSVRRADEGTRNVAALFGGSPKGSGEDDYIRNLHQRTGGILLHGDYGMGDFVNTLAPSAEAKPISNLYIGGHIVLLPAQNTDGIAPPDDQDEHAGALIAGTRDRNNVMNDKFLPAYDARVAELGLTPRQIWAENANVNIKLCYGARYGREMLEQFAERLPEDVTINAYTEPFVWSTSRKYPFGITTNLRHRLGEDNPGLVRIKGKWRPDAGQQASVPGPASDLAGGSSESSVNLGQ